MRSVMIGVVSYLPADIKLREKRLKGVTTQLSLLRNIYPDNRYVVITQNYSRDDLSALDNVEHIDFDSPLGAGCARNKILDIFYKTEYDFLLLCDDDTIYYPYYDIESLLRQVESHPEMFYETMAFSLLEPEYHPYKLQNYQDINILNNHRFIPRELNSGSAFGFILNIRKHFGKELYFNNMDANKGEGREDIDFLIKWLLEGYTWYHCTTAIKKNLNMNSSSIFGDDVAKRDHILQVDLDRMCEIYAGYGLSRDDKGRITWRNFNDLYNKSKKLHYAERLKPITLGEKETPKNVDVTIKSNIKLNRLF